MPGPRPQRADAVRPERIQPRIRNRNFEVISAYISHLLDKKARSTTPRGDGVSVFLCNFLAEHGVKSVKVLKQAGLRHDTPADWQTCDEVHALYMASQKFMPQTLHTDSEGASDNDDSDERPSLVDSDSDT